MNRKIKVTTLLTQEQFRKMAPPNLKILSIEDLVEDANKEMNRNINESEILRGSCVEFIEEEDGPIV